jgi:hypothetical protein
MTSLTIAVHSAYSSIPETIAVKLQTFRFSTITWSFCRCFNFLRNLCLRRFPCSFIALRRGLRIASLFGFLEFSGILTRLWLIRRVLKIIYVLWMIWLALILFRSIFLSETHPSWNEIEFPIMLVHHVVFLLGELDHWSWDYNHFWGRAAIRGLNRVSAVLRHWKRWEVGKRITKVLAIFLFFWSKSIEWEFYSKYIYYMLKLCCLTKAKLFI